MTDRRAVAEAFFGKTEEGCCVSCKNKVSEFKDELSLKEFAISGLCQTCQDAVFGGEEDDVF